MSFTSEQAKDGQRGVGPRRKSLRRIRQTRWKYPTRSTSRASTNDW